MSIIPHVTNKAPDKWKKFCMILRLPPILCTGCGIVGIIMYPPTEEERNLLFTDNIYISPSEMFFECHFVFWVEIFEFQTKYIANFFHEKFPFFEQRLRKRCRIFSLPRFIGFQI